MTDQVPDEEEAILWYQAPEAILQDSNRLNSYYYLMDYLHSNLEFPVEHVFCDVTNTINLAGKAGVFLPIDTALKIAGFTLKPRPSGDALDPQQREEFIQMILQGGSYSG